MAKGMKEASKVEFRAIHMRFVRKLSFFLRVEKKKKPGFTGPIT